MKSYSSTCLKSRHAVKLLHAISSLSVDPQCNKPSLALCLPKLHRIYRNFDNLSTDTHQIIELSVELWDGLNAEEQMGQLLILSALQGVEEGIDKQLVELALSECENELRKIA